MLVRQGVWLETTQRHVSLNGLTFSHVICVIIVACYNIHGNEFLQPSDELEFEETETTENRVLKFLGHFP